MTQYQKLNERIIKVYGTQCKFANAMGMSEQLLSHKLNSKVYWKSNEMEKAINLLSIKRKEIPDFFFPLY